MKSCLFALIACGLASAASAQAPDRPITDPLSVSAADKPTVTPPIRALFEAHGSLGAAWGADGRSVIVSTNQGGRYNLWRYSLGGGARQISRSDDREWGQTVSPDGATVVFQSDKAGGEHYDLFAVPTAGGEAVNLTNTPDISETNAQFSPDGRTLAFDHKLASEPGSNVALLDMSTHAVRLLTHETDPKMSWRTVAWTDGGKTLIADRSNFLGTKGGVWRIDVDTGAAKEITPPETGEILTAASDVSQDGRYLAVASNVGSEQLQAGLFDIASGKMVWLHRTPWEQATASFSPDGKTLLFQTNADGRTEMALYDIASGTVRPLNLPPGVNGAAGAGRSDFSPDSRLVLVSHAASNAPFDYWVYDTASGKGRRLTHFGPTSFDPADLPASNLVHYKSADGTVISAFLWIPNGLKRDGHAPGVVLPHGGPTGQTTDVFNKTAIALASRGYVVIAPNVRGSTGYGRAFQLMNIKDLGGGDLTDEVYATKFMIATGYVDPKKLGITGGSYGGYMTLMAIGKTPDLWAAAVEEYGIIDWLTMLKGEDPELQAYEKSLLGDPDKEPKVYADDSPITFIRQAKAPLLVLQGDNDIRVPKEEAEQVVAILKGEGRTVEAHYYPNEGHGFVKLENVIDSLERTIAWFETYVKTAP